MSIFSKRSLLNLLTCEKDLQTLFNEVIKHYDFSIICGHRGAKAQEEAYKMGNSRLIYPHSAHNSIPSRAVDIAPYPIDWNDIERFKELAVIVKRTAKELSEKGLIDIDIEWGGDWLKFKDYVHWEIK